MNMLEEGVIWTESEPIREKMVRIRELLPGQPDIVYHFVDDFRVRMADDRVGPLLYISMQQSATRFTRSGLERRQIAHAIPAIIQTVCDHEFAEAVLKFAKQIERIIDQHDMSSLHKKNRIP